MASTENGSIISGPYRATKLWNASVRAFHAGMPLGKHRRGLRVYEGCFSGAEAIAWLHKHLCANPNFSRTVTTEQTTALLKKFVRCGLFEDVIASYNSQDNQPHVAVTFKERGLYRFSSMSPLKALRTPGRFGSSDARTSSRRMSLQKKSASPSFDNTQKFNYADSKVNSSTFYSSNDVNYHSVVAAAKQNCYQSQENCFQNQENCFQNKENCFQNKENCFQNKENCFQNKENCFQNKENCFQSQENCFQNKENCFQNKENCFQKQENCFQKHDNCPRICQCPPTTTTPTVNKILRPSDLKARKKLKARKQSIKLNSRPVLQSIENYCNLNEVQSAPSKTEYNNVHSTAKNMNEIHHNAINTISEHTSTAPLQPNYQNVPQRRETEESNSNMLRSKSRVKSFLIKQSSKDSRYYQFIPRMFDSKSTCSSSSTLYDSSKTISPRLLHSVTGVPLVSVDKNLRPAATNPTDGDKEYLSERNLEVKEDIPVSEDTKLLYVKVWNKLVESSLCGESLHIPHNIVCGDTLHHNQCRLTPRGVVKVQPAHPEDLPHWMLAAMRFLAHWPSTIECESASLPGSIPNYTGVEKDVYRMVKDYFCHQKMAIVPHYLCKALLEMLAAIEFLDLTFRVPIRYDSKHRSCTSLSALANPHTGEHSTKCASAGHSPNGYDVKDSVEDLMLNMSVGLDDQNTNSMSVTSNPSTDYLCNASVASSNVFMQEEPELNAINQITPSSARSDVRSSCSIHSSQGNSSTSHLKQLSSTNISHIEHFSKPNSSALYVSGNDVRKRKQNQKINRNLTTEKSASSPDSSCIEPYASLLPFQNKFEDNNPTTLLSTSQIEQMDLPPNSCFETAFTSDSPKTRIIPQKAVDTLHLRQMKRRRHTNLVDLQHFKTSFGRPKSIAISRFSPSLDELTHSDLAKQWEDYPPGNLIKTASHSHQCDDTNTADMNRSKSAGDLAMVGMNEEWRSESTVMGSNEVFTAPSTTTINEVGNSEGGSFFRGSNFVNRVRDSIRRKKLKDAGNVSLRKMTRKSPHNSLSDDVEHGRHPSEASSYNGPPHDANTLNRFRTPSGGFTNPGMSISPHYVDMSGKTATNSITKYQFGQPDITPKCSPIQPMNSISYIRPTVSPFALSSNGETTPADSISSLSNCDSRYQSFDQSSRNCSVPQQPLPIATNNYSKAYRILGCKPPLTSSNVTTTMYPTRLSTNYAFNRAISGKMTSATPAACLSHSMNSHSDETDSRNITSDSVSGSMNSLYTTALACYDESDPKPLAVKELEDRQNPNRTSGSDVSMRSKYSEDIKEEPSEECVGGQSTLGETHRMLFSNTESLDERLLQSLQGQGYDFTHYNNRETAAINDMGASGINHHNSEASGINHHNSEASGVNQRNSEASGMNHRNPEASGINQINVHSPSKWSELPRVYTAEGKARLVQCTQLLLLLLQPVTRKRLHLLLRLLHKMSHNKQLHLQKDSEKTNAQLVLEDMCWSILRSEGSSLSDSGDGGPSRRLLSYLVEEHEELLQPSPLLAEMVERESGKVNQGYCSSTPTVTKKDLLDWQRSHLPEEAIQPSANTYFETQTLPRNYKATRRGGEPVTRNDFGGKKDSVNVSTYNYNPLPTPKTTYQSYGNFDSVCSSVGRSCLSQNSINENIYTSGGLNNYRNSNHRSEVREDVSTQCYAAKIGSAEYSRQKAIDVQHGYLRQLLHQILDAENFSDSVKRCQIKKFAEVYPDIYAANRHTVPESLRPESTTSSVSRSSAKLKGLLKFASFTSLHKNKKNKK